MSALRTSGTGLMPRGLLLPFLLVGLGILFRANPAGAHCVAYTKGDPEAMYCDEQGLPVYWPRNEIEYIISESFDDAAISGLGGQEARTVVDEVFQSWAQVKCPNEDGDLIETGLQILASPGSTNLRLGGYEECAPQENVISLLSPEEWIDQGQEEEGIGLPVQHHADAFALTMTWFDTRTGRILGADIELNAGAGRYTVCPDEGCDTSGNEIDLANVLAHEVGHFLGLADSQDPEATMYYGAENSDLQKRSLAADDKAGLCALFPAEEREARAIEALSTDRQIECLPPSGEDSPEGEPSPEGEDSPEGEGSAAMQPGSCAAGPPATPGPRPPSAGLLMALAGLFAWAWQGRKTRNPSRG